MGSNGLLPYEVVREDQEIMWDSTTMGYVQLQYAPNGIVHSDGCLPGKTGTAIFGHGECTHQHR